MTKRSMKQIVAVVNRGNTKFWTRIGVAYENGDGSWSLRFDYLPVDPQTGIQLCEFRRDHAEPNGDSATVSEPFA